MEKKDQCWLCDNFNTFRGACDILLKKVDALEPRTCICYQKVKPRKEYNFEEIINSIDAGRRI